MLAAVRMEAILAELEKVHGGALPVREEFRTEELDMDTKRHLHTPEKVRIARYAAAHARDTRVLADSSKFGTITAASVLPLDQAGIITDRLDDRRYLEYTDVKEV